MGLVVAAIDVGSLANIGWWRSHDDDESGGQDLDVLIEQLTTDLNAGSPVALGIEAPLFIPRPSVSSGLNKQRLGERGRPWCAGAGTGALALGIQQSTYVLSAISLGLQHPVSVSFECATLLTGHTQLAVWEAFVSGKAKDPSSASPHVHDARVAVAEFLRRVSSGAISSDIQDIDVLNLAGVALLAAGLSDDTALLTQPCTVVRAPDSAAATRDAMRRTT